jgi:hypothetical protein
MLCGDASVPTPLYGGILPPYPPPVETHKHTLLRGDAQRRPEGPASLVSVSSINTHLSYGAHIDPLKN